MNVKNIIGNLIGRGSFVYQAYYFSKAVLANVKYGFPAKDFICIGVTGTDGKTTTSRMIFHLMREQGLPVCLLSSSHLGIKDKLWQNETHKTSLDHFHVQKFFKEAKNKGCKFAVVETASHGIHQKRIWGIPYDIVLFLNLSREHLDYHKTMDEYSRVKKQLFEICKKSKKKPGITKTGIVNGDDDYAKEFLEVKLPHKYAILKDESKEFKFPNNTKVRKITNINEVEMSWDLDDSKCKLNIPGLYNIENASMALCVIEELKLDYQKAIKDLETFESVPGRMEIVECNHPARIILDYAVTPNAFEKTLKTLKNTTPGKLIHVFGATGNRDKEKRPLLGEISAKIADLPIVTDEEPYDEKVETIMEMISEGIERTGRERINLASRTGKFEMQNSYGFITDRESAISFAMHLAQSPDDTIIITGMGDQTSKIIKGKKIPYSDREVILKEQNPA